MAHCDLNMRASTGAYCVAEVTSPSRKLAYGKPAVYAPVTSDAGTPVAPDAPIGGAEVRSQTDPGGRRGDLGLDHTSAPAL